ncbi:MAG: hypothetical protein WCV84_04995 [Patescibacteria group bacterium]
MVIFVGLCDALAKFRWTLDLALRSQFPLERLKPLDACQLYRVSANYAHDPEIVQAIEAECRRPDFYRYLTPDMEGISAVCAMRREGHEVHVFTSLSLDHGTCMEEKRWWVSDSLGDDWAHGMFIADDLAPVEADIVIDDRAAFNGLSHAPKWEHVIFDAPYNRGPETAGKRRLTWKNWREVLKT